MYTERSKAKGSCPEEYLKNSQRTEDMHSRCSVYLRKEVANINVIQGNAPGSTARK
jgi:hypothetical protein